MEGVIEERQKKIVEKLNLKKNWYWFVLAAIAWLGYWIRTRNLPLLVDITTGKYFPADPDASAFLRYAKYILENGSLMTIDYMRYYPWGYGNMIEFKLLSYVIVYLYKVLHFFNPVMTIEKADVLYPPIAFVIGLIFFFLLVKKLFDYRVALVSSVLLTIIPMYLFRTIAGVGDKEAFSMILFFASFYFFLMSWDNKSLKSVLIYGGLAGLITGLMSIVWGGVQFIVVIIALFSFISLFFIQFKLNKYLAYVIWMIISSLFLYIFRDYSLAGLVGGLNNGFVFFVVLSGLVYYLIFTKKLFGINERINGKLPKGFASVVIASLVGILFFIIIFSPNWFFQRLNEIFVTLTSPFGTSRWALTVAEAHQPYFVEWIGHMSWKYVWMFIIGSIWLFYEMCGNFLNNKNKIIGTSLYTFMLFGLMFNRYSQTSILNGESGISRLFYFGSLALLGIVFLWYSLSTFKKNKELFKNKVKINQHYLLVLIWFFIMLIGARSATRILFVFAPITCVLAGVLVMKLFDLSLKRKDLYRYAVWILLFLLLINPFSISSFAYGILDDGVINNFYERTVIQARGIGPGYNAQWQIAGQWTRENTPEDAVFAHWWDYGYWVQTGFERATVTDGGNAKGSLNHMMGRHVLTGQNEIEALEFLKAHNVTNLLIVSDEIGKYPAFSSIGADENWDRYSWINVFTREDTYTRETRDGIVNIYTGGTPLDWDFIYNNELFPKGSSGLIAIILPSIKTNDSIAFLQPRAVLVNNGKQTEVPLKCLLIDRREIEYSIDGLGGCFVIIPRIDNNIDLHGNGLYISEKVRDTLFYKLYLTGQNSEHFELVYSDGANVPLAMYNGRIIGPLKIWNVTYPKDLEVPMIYYEDVLPNPKVESIEGRY